MQRRHGGGTLTSVTHPHDHAAATTTGHAPTIIVVLACAFLVVCALVPLLLVARCAWTARRALSGCPVCGGRDVREDEADRLRFADAEDKVQCGVCIVWRRLVVNQADQ